MRTLIYTLVLGVSAHLAAGQNFRDSKSQEFRFDDYKFLPSPFNPNFLQDPARLKPNIEPQGKQLHGFNSGLNKFPREGYTKYEQIPGRAHGKMYAPFDGMPFLIPYGLYRMNVLEPDMSLYDMPVK